jgi:hypothetical protein
MVEEKPFAATRSLVSRSLSWFCRCCSSSCILFATVLALAVSSLRSNPSCLARYCPALVILSMAPVPSRLDRLRSLVVAAHSLALRSLLLLLSCARRGPWDRRYAQGAMLLSAFVRQELLRGVEAVSHMLLDASVVRGCNCGLG